MQAGIACAKQVGKLLRNFMLIRLRQRDDRVMQTYIIEKEISA